MLKNSSDLSFLEEVWKDKYGLGGDEEDVCITLREEGSPWSCRLDLESLEILSELFGTLSKEESKELSVILFEAASNL